MRAGAASAIVRARLVASTEVSAVPGGGCEVLGPLRLPRNCPHLEYEITNPKYGNRYFEMPFKYKCDHFTMTGSGQTYRESSTQKKTTAVFLGWTTRTSRRSLQCV